MIVAPFAVPLRIERFDARNTRRGVEVLVGTPIAALRVVLGRFLEVELQAVHVPDRVKPLPRLANVKPSFW